MLREVRVAQALARLEVTDDDLVAQLAIHVLTKEATRGVDSGARWELLF